jgi:hypothetical protein
MTTNRYHPSWSEEAQAAFEGHIAAHGGFEAWEALRVIEFEPQEVGGFLLALKGLGRTCFAPRRIVAHVKERRVEFVYGSHTDTYANGAVTSRPRDVRVKDGRELFRGTTFEPWYPEHVAYFFGYAWTNYLSLPFLLPDLELVAAQVRGARHSYCVRFPEGAHTHSPLQRCAHYSWDYTNYRGIRLAGRRSARPRLGPFALPLNGIGARLAFR